MKKKKKKRKEQMLGSKENKSEFRIPFIQFVQQENGVYSSKHKGRNLLYVR